MPAEALPVLIPLLNANEPEAQLAALHVQPGQHVKAGDLLCTLETTKAAADLEAEGEGYIAGLRFAQGDTARAGDLMCYLAPTPGWQPPAAPVPALSDKPAQPAGLRITQPALALARQHQLDLSELPAGLLITEKTIRQHLEKQNQPAVPAAETPLDPHALVIYGGGGHAKALIDLISALGSYRIVGVLDDGLDPAETPHILGVPLLGGAEKLPGLFAQGVRLAVNAVGGIGNVSIRIRIFQRLAQAGFTCPPLVHPTAFVEPSAQLSPGVQVFPHAYVGSEARLGFGVIVNTGAIVSHECLIGDYSNLSPGSILAGQVQVGEGVLIGMGVTINLRAVIGQGARLGNSAVVKADVPAGGIVRAGATWPPDKA
jgi:sugar O-acyltransferase (sialic acid O-acetyltransferase NeuD family)